MRAKSIYTTRDAQAAKCLLPGDGVRFFAVFNGKSIWSLGSPPDKAVNSLLKIDERLFHGLEGRTLGLFKQDRVKIRPAALENRFG